MQIKRTRSTVFQLTLHAFNLAALVSAIRWIIDGAKGELTAEAKHQLQQIIANYDAECQKLNSL